MGYGDGKVDWSIQAPTLMPDPGAYQKGQNQGAAAIYKQGLDELVETCKAWRAKAVEAQQDADSWVAEAWSWKETALHLRDEYAPHLTDVDVKSKYQEILPKMEKKYYKEFVKDRTWDK